jgi:hypothetical protein
MMELDKVVHGMGGVDTCGEVGAPHAARRWRENQRQILNRWDGELSTWCAIAWKR